MSSETTNKSQVPMDSVNKRKEEGSSSVVVEDKTGSDNISADLILDPLEMLDQTLSLSTPLVNKTKSINGPSVSSNSSEGQTGSGRGSRGMSYVPGTSWVFDTSTNESGGSRSSAPSSMEGVKEIDAFLEDFDSEEATLKQS
jgi:hypothetical protein